MLSLTASKTLPPAAVSLQFQALAWFRHHPRVVHNSVTTTPALLPFQHSSPAVIASQDCQAMGDSKLFALDDINGNQELMRLPYHL